jgi:hypothetical protein
MSKTMTVTKDEFETLIGIAYQQGKTDAKVGGGRQFAVVEFPETMTCLNAIYRVETSSIAFKIPNSLGKKNDRSL